VAGVHSLDGEIAGVWRIKIAAEGRTERRGMGSIKGNAARLFEYEPELPLVIAEGVEDALAARELSGFPAWAALSANNMSVLELPVTVRSVIVYADGDEAGLNAARTLVRRLKAEGRQAKVMRPVAGRGKDPNDALLTASPAAGGGT
jgi:hypothetical protein